MFLLPVVLALAALAFPSNRFRPWLLPVAGAAQAALVGAALASSQAASPSGLLYLDPVGKVVLLLVSLVYLVCSFYAVGYLKYRRERSNRIFVACLAAFLAPVSLVAWSHHLGLTWVAIEATTLVTAPLIYFNRTKRSIEATWKFLLVGSVGIALALLGTFFLAYSLLVQGVAPVLTLTELLKLAPQMSKPWLRAAFILLLIGYGTKMGLAPMQTWKPDAYGEAPGVVGAVLAAGTTSLAFLAFLRIYQIVVAAGEGAFASRLLLFMGLFSMAVAGVFMLGQKDFKRMLAYSSVEHMGILTLGLGIGGPALFGVLLHLLTNGVAKGALFLSAANIHRGYGAKTTDEVSGALRRLPLSGGVFLAGFIAITGSPPFGPFVSEFAILAGAFQAGDYLAAGLFLVFLLVVFIGMGNTVLKTVLGESAPAELAAPASLAAPAAAAAPDALAAPYRETLRTALPALAFLALTLLLGLYLPPPLRALLDDAVRFLEFRP
jgi:hydrogenase-4 component F